MNLPRPSAGATSVIPALRACRVHHRRFARQESRARFAGNRPARSCHPTPRTAARSSRIRAGSAYIVLPSGVSTLARLPNLRGQIAVGFTRAEVEEGQALRDSLAHQRLEVQGYRGGTCQTARIWSQSCTESSPHQTLGQPGAPHDNMPARSCPQTSAQGAGEPWDEGHSEARTPLWDDHVTYHVLSRKLRAIR